MIYTLHVLPWNKPSHYRHWSYWFFHCWHLGEHPQGLSREVFGVNVFGFAFILARRLRYPHGADTTQ
jgi:hypothetical protein